MSNGRQHVEVGGIGLVTVILALVFLFVWPGPFRCQYMAEPQFGLVKIDRISRQVSVWRDGRFQRVVDFGNDRTPGTWP